MTGPRLFAGYIGTDGAWRTTAIKPEHVEDTGDHTSQPGDLFRWRWGNEERILETREPLYVDGGHPNYTKVVIREEYRPS